MKELNAKIKSELEDIFKERVNFKKYERMLYSSDLGVMPALIKKRIQSVPQAVVLPENEEDLQKLVKLSKDNSIALTARGLGTSGYGGSVPAQGGISVVFTEMHKIKEISEEDLTVTVQPGIIWKDLERKLNLKGLSLRLYPSSFPGSTVGGWLAQGGIGIGSFKYGTFEKNVIEVKAVTADGKTEVFSGSSLNLISQSMGTTGFITEIKLKVRKIQETKTLLIAFDKIENLKTMLSEAYLSKIDLWSVTFINPNLVKLKNMIALSDNLKMPENKYILLAAFSVEAEKSVMDFIEKNRQQYNFEILSEELSTHEWAERFYTMKVKKTGPSLVPSEVIIPLDKIDEFLEKVEKRVKFDFLAEIIASDDKTLTVLGFILSDERKLNFLTTFTSSISIIKIAENLGGKIYASGMYFNYKSPEVLGRENYDSLLEFKIKTDENNLLNPGKIFATSSISKNPAKSINFLMKTAESLEFSLPAIRAVFGNKRSGILKTNKMTEDLLWNATICAQCGYCVQACELYESRHWESSSPRGKWKMLKNYQSGNLKIDDEIVKTFLICTTCKKCDPVCQVDIPIMELWNELRGELVEHKHFATFPAFEMMASSFNHENNIWAEFKQDRDKWVPEDAKIKEDSETLYWAGCTASYVTQDIAKNAVKILNEGEKEFTILGTEEYCCGIPMYMAGKWKEFEKAVRHNIGEINKRNIKKVILSCPGCWVTFKDLYKEWAEKLGLEYDVEIEHITQTTSSLIKEGKLKPTIPINEKVTYHDPCHIGRHGNIYDEPRDIIKAIPQIQFKEMEHNRDDALCCGSVLTRAGEPSPTSDYLGKIRIDEASDIGVETILTTCPCCEVQLRVSAQNNNQNVKVVDLTDYLMTSLGFDSPDLSSKTLTSWNVFGQMIDYMTPLGISVMMKDLMDEIIYAMPGYMKSMMKVINKMPSGIKSGMYKLMKKMMPVLMPKLLPGMMPKVLPDMLAYYEEKVEQMPETMKKLMPVMMPEVMDNLMPHMLRDIIPLILDDMLDSLKNYKF